MTSSRVHPSALSACRRLSPLWLAALCVWLACHVPLPADDDDATPGPAPSGVPSADSLPVDSDDVWILSPSNSGSISGSNGAVNAEPADLGGFGVNTRLGHIAGDGVGRDESITFIEIAPYTTIDSLFLAGDVRFLRTNTGEYAGSGGAIVRRFLPNRNAIFGTNLFFDVDHTYGSQLQEVGFGFEWLSNRLDNRTNFYIPFGTDQKAIRSGVIAGSETFSARNLFYSRFTDQITAATGADTMFTMPVPGRIPELINLEASAGGYYFRPNDGRLRDFGGPKLRVDASSPRRILHAYVEATHDNVNDTLVSLGVDVNYWTRFDDQPRLGGNQFHRITEWVRRNWTMVAVDETAYDNHIAAIDPRTGAPYIFEHVDSNATSLPPDGTFSRPWTTLQQAQAAPPGPPGTITYVHAGSMFDTPLVMNDGEIIVGEGTAFELALLGSPETVLLPATGKPGGRPNFDNITGVPVTLADDVTFAGFTISSTTNGPAILGNGIRRAHLEDIDIQDVNNGHGIHFLNSAGTITLDNVNILRSNPADINTGADVDAFRVEGGGANIVYTNSRIENTLGRAVRVTGAGGSVDMRGVAVNSRFTVTANADEGVIVQNSSADVLFGPLTLQSGTIDLLGISGDITFASPVQLDNPAPNVVNANGIPLRVDGSSGLITFNPGATVVINNRPDVGIDLRNISGRIHFHDAVTVGPSVGLGFVDPALIWQENSGAFIMDGLFTTDDAPESILIGDPLTTLSNQDGSSFRMNGLFDLQNPSVFGQAAIHIINDPSTVTFSGGSITERSLQRGIEIFNTTGNITFNGTTTITDTFASPASAVNIQQATGPVVFDTLTINDDADITAAEARVFVDNSGNITFDELNVTMIGGTTPLTDLVFIQNSGIITSNGGELRVTTDDGTGTAGQAIALLNNQRIAWTSDSISSFGDTNGILVQGQPGHFIVRGSGGAGSGGTIDNTVNAAVFDYTGEDPTDAGNFVELNDMIFSGGITGVTATNLNSVRINNTSFSTVLTSAVSLSDVVNFTLQDSIFTNNLNNVLQATVGINPADTTFTYRLLRNQFVDGFLTDNDSMITIDNVTGGPGATLDLVVQDNGAPTSGLTGFVANRFNPNIADPNLVDESSALAVRWNGPVTQALFQRNSFALIGGVGQEGVEFINADSSATTNFSFIENTLNANTSEDAIGVRLDIAGPANVDILGNQTLNTPGRPFQGIVMNGLRAQAFRMTLRNTSTVRMDDNEIQMFNDDSVGFNFPFIGGNMNFIANGNLIQFNQQFTSVGDGERGFDFGPVAATVFFSGNRNNEVRFAQPDAFSRAFPDPFVGPHVGTIIVNRQRVPQ